MKVYIKKLYRTCVHGDSTFGNEVQINFSSRFALVPLEENRGWESPFIQLPKVLSKKTQALPDYEFILPLWHVGGFISLGDDFTRSELVMVANYTTA